jgi:peptidyl-prolyl cis-trans isomerase SurA
MNAMKPRLLIAGILIAIFFAAADCPAEISNRVVAMVNNDVITLYELNNRIKELTGKASEEIKSEDEETFIEVRRQVLENMINEKIAQEKIQELGLQISQADVDAYFENIKKSKNWTQEDLLSELKNDGLSYETYRRQIKDSMEQEKLINYEVKSKAVILEGQILKYYQEHPDEYRKDEKVHVAGIVLLVQNQENKDELNELKKKGEEILARLKSGEDFGAMAKEFSQGPGADEGGELGVYDPAELDTELKKVIDGLSDGDVSGVIARDTGIQIIKLIKREGGNIKPFEEVRNEIYETIYNEELNKRYTTWLKDLRDKSFTKINF